MAIRITSHLINRNCTFINQMNPPYAFMIHRTAGHRTNQQLYDYWNSSCVSSHYGINWDGDQGDIWQFVNLWDGAGANCCTDNDAHPFFYNRGGNANTYTVSVEVCTPDTGNRGLMQQGQEDALVYLIQYVVAELGINTTSYYEWYNGSETAHTWIHPTLGGIGMHRDIAPHNKYWCPGDPYFQGQIDRVIQRVKGGTNVPIFLPPDHNNYIIRHWQAYYENMGDLAACPQRDTGIFKVWSDLLKQNIDLGSVTTEEIRNSGPWLEQHYTAGTIFWNTDKYEVHVTTGAGPR